MSLPWATLVGCSKEPGASGGGGGGVRIAKKILLPIVRKISLVYDAIVTVNDLVVEIKAMIDGKVETIEARLTKEQAEALSNGGELIIKGEDGTEFPVEHKVK
jgi:hypothetical protein